MGRKLLRYSPLLIVVLLLIAGWFHRYWLFDSYRLAFYDPSPEIVQLADRSGMSDHGRRLFYAARPELLQEAEFDQKCQFAELGLVLGCYRSADIFILDVDDEQLEPVEPVTAAHEMLHVVFGRFTTEEEAAMNELLDIQLTKVTNQRILETIEGYQKDPNADLYNEMHSIFGTELATLIPELEEHYGQFFSDRQMVIAESTAYEAVFIELESEIDRLDARLNQIETQVVALEAEISSLSTQIDVQRAELDSLLAANQINAYNARVPVFNNLVATHNQKVNEVKTLIAEFNEIVAQRNTNAAAKNDLIKSLDSNLETIE